MASGCPLCVARPWPLLCFLLGLSFDHRCVVVALWLKVSPPEALRYKAESEREAVRIEARLRSNLRATSLPHEGWSCKKMVMR